MFPVFFQLEYSVNIVVGVGVGVGVQITLGVLFFNLAVR